MSKIDFLYIVSLLSYEALKETKPIVENMMEESFVLEFLTDVSG